MSTYNNVVSICLPAATAHRSALSAVYDELRCGKEKLTAEEFLECASNYCAQQVTSRRKQQTTSFMTMTNTLFQALDANNNGYLTPKEWEGIFYMWNYPDFETIAVEAFKAADKSKDGKISPEEFQQFGVSLVSERFSYITSSLFLLLLIQRVCHSKECTIATASTKYTLKRIRGRCICKRFG